MASYDVTWTCARLYVATMPDSGDSVITCCADGVARVWTADASKADPEAGAAMENQMVVAAEEKAKASLAARPNVVHLHKVRWPQ